MFGVRLLSAIAFLLTVVAVVPAAQTMPQDHPGVPVPEFVRFFDTLALTADYGPFNRRPPRVRKWVGPVTIVAGEGTERLTLRLESLARQLSDLTSLPFSVAGPEGYSSEFSGNTIFVRIVSRLGGHGQFEADDIVCQTETHGTGGVIQTAFVVISNDYADCLEHEFMHVLGFDAHWQPPDDSPIRSVLALRGSPLRTDAFSPSDILAIRLLYDWRMRAGMERRETLHVIHEILDDRPQNAALTGNGPIVRVRWESGLERRQAGR